MEEKKIVIPDMPELTFDENTHTYRVNGIIIPSVSTLLKPLSDAEYAGIPEKTLERAANKGSSVHNAIEIFLDFEIDDCPEEVRPYFNAFLKWWEDRKPVVIGSEIRMYHKLFRYGGTTDLLCYIGDKVVLVDYKTTYSTNEKTWRLQLEGYQEALESHGVKVDEKMILHLKKDGTYKEFVFPAKDAVGCRAFTSLKCLYDYNQSYKKS